MKRYIWIFILLFSISIFGSERVTIEISLEDHKFIPEKIEAPAGKVLVLIIHNKDNVAEEFESHKLKREKIIPANSKAKIVIGPLEPGIYDFFGEFYDPQPKGVLVIQ